MDNQDQSSNPVNIIEKIIEIDEHKIKLIYVQIYKSLMIWIGDPSAPKLESLSLAIGSCSTSILSRNDLDSMDNEMAKKLSKRFHGDRPIYVAYNYAPVFTDSDLKLKVDKYLIEFIQTIS